MADNPLIAQEEQGPSGFINEGSGDAGWSSGSGLAEAVNDVSSLDDGSSWVESGLAWGGLAMEGVGVVVDPIGTLASNGVGWLIDHVEPLQEALDWFAGDPEGVQAYGETWANVAKSVDEAAARYNAAIKTDTAEWTGEAGDAYRQYAMEKGEAIGAAARLSSSVSSVVMIMGEVVTYVREFVRDTVADCIGRLITYAAEAMAPPLVSLFWVVPQAINFIRKTVDRIWETIDKLLTTLTNVLPKLMRLMEVLGEVMKVLAKMGSKAVDGISNMGRQVAKLTDKVDIEGKVTGSLADRFAESSWKKIDQAFGTDVVGKHKAKFGPPDVPDIPENESESANPSAFSSNSGDSMGSGPVAGIDSSRTSQPGTGQGVMGPGTADPRTGSVNDLGVGHGSTGSGPSGSTAGAPEASSPNSADRWQGGTVSGSASDPGTGASTPPSGIPGETVGGGSSASAGQGAPSGSGGSGVSGVPASAPPNEPAPSGASNVETPARPADAGSSPPSAHPPRTEHTSATAAGTAPGGGAAGGVPSGGGGGHSGTSARGFGGGGWTGTPGNPGAAGRSSSTSDVSRTPAEATGRHRPTGHPDPTRPVQHGQPARTGQQPPGQQLPGQQPPGQGSAPRPQGDGAIPRGTVGTPDGRVRRPGDQGQPPTHRRPVPDPRPTSRNSPAPHSNPPRHASDPAGPSRDTSRAGTIGPRPAQPTGFRRPSEPFRPSQPAQPDHSRVGSTRNAGHDQHPGRNESNTAPDRPSAGRVAEPPVPRQDAPQRATSESMAAEEPPDRLDPSDRKLVVERKHMPKLSDELKTKLGDDRYDIAQVRSGVSVIKPPKFSTPLSRQQMGNAAPDPKRFTVEVHGGPDGVYFGDKALSPEELAEIIKASPGYTKGEPVRLLACKTGGDTADGSPNFAERLAKELDVEVLAPNTDAWVDNYGNMYASKDKASFETGSSDVPQPSFDEPGQWISHRPDGSTAVHDSPFPPGHRPNWTREGVQAVDAVRRGTAPTDLRAPPEFDHPGGPRFSGLHHRPDEYGTPIPGHLSSTGEFVPHGTIDAHGTWRPHGQVDSLGRWTPGHLEGGKLVPNGHYDQAGRWFPHGRTDEAGRWIPSRFDGARFHDAGRYHPQTHQWEPFDQAGRDRGQGGGVPPGNPEPPNRAAPRVPPQAQSSRGQPLRGQVAQGPPSHVPRVGQPPDGHPPRGHVPQGQPPREQRPAVVRPQEIPPPRAQPQSQPHTRSQSPHPRQSPPVGQQSHPRSGSSFPQRPGSAPHSQAPPQHRTGFPHSNPPVRPHPQEVPRRGRPQPATSDPSTVLGTSHRPEVAHKQPLPEKRPPGAETPQHDPTGQPPAAPDSSESSRQDALGEGTAEPVVRPGAPFEERVEIIREMVDRERVKHYPPQEKYSTDDDGDEQNRRRSDERMKKERVDRTFPKPSRNPTPEQYQQLARMARKYGVPLVDMPETSGPREFSAAPEGTDLDSDALHAANDNLRFLNGVNTVYRCDQRYPAEILDDDGFRPRERPDTEEGSGYDLNDHVNSNGWSNFVSTSTDLDETIKRVNTRGLGNASFVYTMEAPGGIDVNRSLDNSIYSDEQEIAFAGGVDSRYITGAYMIERTDSGEQKATWIPRERFAEFTRPSGSD